MSCGLRNWGSRVQNLAKLPTRVFKKTVKIRLALWSQLVFTIALVLIQATRSPSCCTTKAVPSFLSYFKFLSIGLAPRIQPRTSRSAANDLPTDLVLSRFIIEVRHCICGNLLFQGCLQSCLSWCNWRRLESTRHGRPWGDLFIRTLQEVALGHWISTQFPLT